MGKMSTAQARQQFSEVLNRAAYGKERVILTRRRRDLAAVIPVEDLQLLEDLEDQIDLEDARKALQDAKKNGTVAWKEVKRAMRKRR